ncbi:MAG: hypothetical protein KDE09_20815 [Anaerolineales bacterium]|nr:hypothetical protein [Anaerolineales bacterium]
MIRFLEFHYTLEELQINLKQLHQQRPPTKEEFADYLQYRINQVAYTLQPSEVEEFALRVNHHTRITVYENYEPGCGTGYRGRLMVAVDTEAPDLPETFIWHNSKMPRVTSYRPCENHDLGASYPVAADAAEDECELEF